MERIDKETNTECIFMPEKGGKSSTQGIVIKRSQTFSPTATNQYICRVSKIFILFFLIL